MQLSASITIMTASDSRMDILMPSLKAAPTSLVSWVLQARRWVPHCIEGPCSWCFCWQWDHWVLFSHAFSVSVPCGHIVFDFQWLNVKAETTKRSQISDASNWLWAVSRHGFWWRILLVISFSSNIHTIWDVIYDPTGAIASYPDSISTHGRIKIVGKSKWETPFSPPNESQICILS